MIINSDDVVAIPVDMQERLMPVIYNSEEIINKSEILIKGLKLLDIPILVPRQYPKGLGDTVEQIKNALDQHTPIDKTSFGCVEDSEFLKQLLLLEKKTAIVFGAEAHVCVLQTILQLADKGYKTVLVCDAIGSRHAYDKEIAIKRAQHAGAILTTTESILFELIKCSKHKCFKEISTLIK